MLSVLAPFPEEYSGWQHPHGLAVPGCVPCPQWHLPEHIPFSRAAVPVGTAGWKSLGCCCSAVCCHLMEPSTGIPPARGEGWALSAPHRWKSAKKTGVSILQVPGWILINCRQSYCLSWCSLFLSLLQALDGNIYDHLKDYLMAFSRTELETCQAVQNTFQFLLETSSRVSLNWMILCNWILTAWTNPQASKIITKLKGCYFWLLQKLS